MTDQSTVPQAKSDDEPQESDESQESIAIPDGGEELEKLSIKILEKLSVTVSERFTGPIPPPNIMEQYEKTLPGSADRIIKMAENQSEHRQSLEKQGLSFANREVHVGQVLGFAIGVIAIVTGGYIASSGAQISGGIMGTSVVVGLVSVFVIGSKRKPPKERENRQDGEESRSSETEN